MVEVEDEALGIGEVFFPPESRIELSADKVGKSPFQLGVAFGIHAVDDAQLPDGGGDGRLGIAQTVVKIRFLHFPQFVCR